MSISQEDIQRLAFLVRIELTPMEELAMIEHLNTLLTYVEKLNRVNTDGIDPMVHVVEFPSPMREDRVTNQPDIEALLRNAPEREGDFFKVPRIIE